MRSMLLVILAPLALASPMALSVGAQNKTRSCLSRSPAMVEWEVEDFDYHASYTFSTPSHQNSWGYVSFTVVNPVHETRTRCSAQSNRLQHFFYGDTQYECDSDGGSNMGATLFTFNRPSGEVTLEQTWYCHDQPDHPPARFIAKGDITTQLACEETSWENGNWTLGGIYSQSNTTCDITDVIVPVKELTGIARK